jgi:hypothetical protein
MQFSNEQMDAAVSQYRQMKTIEEFYRELAESPDFKAALESAYARDPSFFTVDAAGAHPKQFNVAVPPAPPKVNGAPELDWTERERRRKPISGAAFPS